MMTEDIGEYADKAREQLEERVAKAKQDREEFNARLAELGFGPEYRIESGGAFGALLSASSGFANCQQCGAVVSTATEPTEDQTDVEPGFMRVERRWVEKHVAFHNWLNR